MLMLVLQFAHSARADPSVANEGGGFERATWDFGTPSDYDATGVALAPGAATLAKTVGWRNYTTDAEFLAAKSSSDNVTVSSGVRLTGNGTNLVQDGTFDQTSGPWSYTNGTMGMVTAERDGAGRARLGHAAAVRKFDSMDDISGPNPWVSVISNPGDATSNVSQETANRMEGSGSLRDDVTILQNGNRWGGAMRNDPLPWNWTGFDRLALRLDKATPGFLWAWVLLQDQAGGQAWGFWTPVTGWARYAFDLSPYTPAFNTAAVDFIWVGFQAAVGVPTTIYLDDLVVFNATAFGESARVEQTFTKSAPTDGSPNSLGLSFDLEATPSSNVASSLQVTVDGAPVWSETPVAAGNRSIYVDLGGNAALQGTGNFTLRFSLQLNRTGWEEASMTAWIDNVSFLAPGYRNGSFASTPVNAGSAAIWTTAAAASTLPPATALQVETRTGSTGTPGDPTWSAWQPAPGGGILSPPGRYLQWRFLLGTTDQGRTPIVTGLTLAFSTYATTGELRTHPFFPTAPLLGWRQFLANGSAPPGTTTAYDLSFDGGAIWSPATNGEDLSARPLAAVIVRATLWTANTTASPTLAWIALRYEIQGPGTLRINGVVPDQTANEDDTPWVLNLTAFAANQPDPNDTADNLAWYLTGVDTNLTTVFWQHAWGVLKLQFRPVHDAFGTNQARLWLEDRNGARASQVLNITLRPVNDPPYFEPEDLSVKAGEPYPFDWSPHIVDVDNPPNELTLRTDDPTHITIQGLNATYTYPTANLGTTLFVSHYVSDGQATARTVVAIHVTANGPPTKQPLPDLTLIEDTPARDVFPVSLREYFNDPEGQKLFFFTNVTYLDVSIWDDGAKVRVNVTGKPNFCGFDRITFRAVDPGGAFAEYTVRVTVACVNDPPVLGWTQDVRLAFDTTYRLDLAAYVSDVDNPVDDLILTTSDPGHAAVDRLAVSFLYTRAELGPLPSYTIPVTLRLADPASIVTQRIDVIVSDNRPPELATPFDPLQFDEDTNAAVDLARHFLDYEDGITLSWSAQGTDIVPAISGSIATLTPRPNWNGQEVILFRATDRQGAFALGYQLVDVLPVDDPPVFAPLPSQVRAGGGSWVLDLRPYVTDVDNAISELNFTTDSGHVKAAEFMLVFNYPDADASEQIVVTVRDPGGLTDTMVVSVHVTGSAGPGLPWPWMGIGIGAAAGVSFAVWRRRRYRYAIEDLMLIGHDGLLIAHTTRRLHAEMDSDILAAMMTATLMFIRDSFREERNELQRFDLSHDRMGIVEKSEHLYGVAICSGRVADAAHLGLKDFLRDIEERYADRIVAQTGAIDEVMPGLTWAMSVLARSGRYRPGELERLIGEIHEGHTPRGRWGKRVAPSTSRLDQIARVAAGLPKDEDRRGPA